MNYSSRPYLVTALALVLIICLMASDGSARTVVVNTEIDSHDPVPGDGIAGDPDAEEPRPVSLRAALEEVDVWPGIDTILFTADVQTIRLSLGPLRMSGDPTLIVGGWGKPILDGLGNSFNSSLLVIESDRNVVSGLTIRRSSGDALLITGSNNLIGGTSVEDRNVFIQNGLAIDLGAAIAIAGPTASSNRIIGNFIGLLADGLTPAGNQIGIRVGGSGLANEIGSSVSQSGNLISGNRTYGVLLTDFCTETQVANNMIGMEVNGIVVLPNEHGGIKLDRFASHNVIGGDSATQANHISGNGGSGIRLDGSSVAENFIKANSIGLDRTGRVARPNESHGITLTNGAHHNYIGGLEPQSGNLISGNDSSGICISGQTTADNVVVNNLIGLSVSGFAPIGNGRVLGDGVLIRAGARNNRIGGSSLIEANAIAGNHRFGVNITGAGTSNNQVSANHIGANISGTSSVYNSVGVVLSDGASYNVVGGTSSGQGNILSGNRAKLFPWGAGVLIINTGTDHNRVEGNLIGPDIGGNRALRNGSAGVIIGDGAQHNVIGGTIPGARNIISGNGSGEMLLGLGRGVHLFGQNTSFNLIQGNWIGTTTSGQPLLYNNGHGVAVVSGASANQVGGNSPGEGNLIAGNRYHGVYLQERATRENTIRFNQIFANDSLGIVLADNAQDNMPTPMISLAQPRAVTGVATSLAWVEIYLAAPDYSGSGEATELLGFGRADQSGQFDIAIFGAQAEDTVTAQATDTLGNSSALAINAVIQSATSVGEDSPLPLIFALQQNYPNPFNPTTTIAYSLPRAGAVDLCLYNTMGQKVRSFPAASQTAGVHEVIWNGCDNDGNLVASGVYFYRLSMAGEVATKKLLLLK